MATRYIITATANHASETLSNPKSAKAKAEKRAAADNETVHVMTASTGKVVATYGDAPKADATPDLPVGTAVSVADSITGVTASEPTLTPVGYIVSVDYDAEHAHLSPTGGADHDVEDLTVIPDEATEILFAALVAGEDQAPQETATEKAEAPKAKAAKKTARREALRPSVVPSWDVLYDKPRQNAQVVRKYVEGKAVYALLCTTHTRLRQLTRLTQERTLRANGGWCAACVKAETKATAK